jgi:hypothetical protein
MILQFQYPTVPPCSTLFHPVPGAPGAPGGTGNSNEFLSLLFVSNTPGFKLIAITPSLKLLMIYQILSKQKVTEFQILRLSNK